MVGIVIGVIVVAVVLFFAMQSSLSLKKSDDIKESFKQLEGRLWRSYVDFSITKQNELYARYLDEESRARVVETNELPNELVLAIHTFHEQLGKELMEMETYYASIEEPANQELVRYFITYLQARNTFLNKEWGYTRALLKQQEDALLATQLYRHARNQQTAAYEVFAAHINQRAKKLKVENRFQQ